MLAETLHNSVFCCITMEVLSDLKNLNETHVEVS